MSLWVFVVMISFPSTGFVAGFGWFKASGEPSQGPWNFTVDAHMRSTLHIEQYILGLPHPQLVQRSKIIPGDSLGPFSCPSVPQSCFPWGGKE